MVLDKLQTSGNLGHVNRFWPGVCVLHVMEFFKLFEKGHRIYERREECHIKLFCVL
jgi:hypothetical protein